MTKLVEQDARAILTTHKIERGLDDHRSAAEIVTALGLPITDVATEDIIAPDLAESLITEDAGVLESEILSAATKGISQGVQA